MSVNVSSRYLHQGKAVADVRAVLASQRIRAESL